MGVKIKKHLKSFAGILASAACLGAFATTTSMAAETYAGTSFDENGAYYGPDCDKDKNYSGTYYTGNYESPFKKVLGKTDAEIQEKMDALWNHYFKGDDNSKVYYDRGSEAYIKDINNNDVRSEGMSYGMMIAVQTGHKEEFDKLWNWAKNHMWHKSGGWDGYFVWQRNDSGTGGDDNCAPDGEMYFMMSLLFAANRWNDSKYMEDAQYILKKMWDNGQHSLFNPQEQYTQGEAGANAVAAMALINDSKYDAAVKKNLELAWDTKFMTGQYRYYDGLVHYLAMLHLSGTFKIWKPKPTVESEEKTITETEINGVTYNDGDKVDYFEGCKLYKATIAKKSAPDPDSAVTNPDSTVTNPDSTIAIRTTVALNNNVRVWSTNSAIVIENAPAGTKYTVTDLNGRVLTASKTATSTQEVRLAKTGPMLVIVGNKAYKVVK